MVGSPQPGCCWLGFVGRGTRVPNKYVWWWYERKLKNFSNSGTCLDNSRPSCKGMKKEPPPPSLPRIDQVVWIANKTTEQQSRCVAALLGCRMFHILFVRVLLLNKYHDTNDWDGMYTVCVFNDSKRRFSCDLMIFPKDRHSLIF